jgi:enoyl-CoA hydratase/carnithine racemase
MGVNIQGDAGIQWLMLDHPPVNALSGAMIEEIIAALGRFADDPDTRVVVLGGNGRHFCAGADLREQQQAWQTGGVGAADLGVSLYTALLGFPKPLIGMAQGAVMGAGLSLMACCDIAVAAHGTRISLPEINVGVLGGVSHARSVLGKSLVNYLALTGSPIDAETLRHSGLFFDVVPPDSLRGTVEAIAVRIAGKHPEAARYTKRCMRAVEGVTPLQGYVLENELSVALRRSGVTDELIGAFLTRSKRGGIG